MRDVVALAAALRSQATTLAALANVLEADAPTEAPKLPALEARLTVDEIAARVGVSRRVVLDAYRRGDLDAARIGRVVSATADAVERWIASRRRPRQAPAGANVVELVRASAERSARRVSR